jgi:hypothetical protein
MHKGDEAALLMPGDFSDNPYSQPTGDLQSIASFVTGLSPSIGKAEMSDALSAAAGIFERDRGLNEQLFIVSDRQALNWTQVTEPFAKSWRQRFSKRHALLSAFYIPVGGDESDNIAVESLDFLNPPAIADQPIDADVTVRNYGPAPQTAVPLTIRSGGQTVLDTTVSVPPGASTTVQARMTIAAPGSHVVSAQLKSSGLTFDDRLEASLDVVDPIPVLIVSGDGGGNLANIPATAGAGNSGDGANAGGGSGNGAGGANNGADAGGGQASGSFTSEADFIKLALAPFHAPERPGPNIAAVDVVNAAGDWSDFASRHYRVVVLADVPTLTDAQTRALEEHVYGGGGLLVAPGSLTRVDDYNAALYRDGAGLLPASLSPATPRDGSGETALMAIDPTHPIFGFLKDRPDPTPAARIIRYFPAVPRVPDARVLGSYATGKPFAIEGRSGRGRVLMVTTALDSDWSSLPLSNFYLPFVQSAVRYLAASESADRNLAPGEPIVAMLDEPVDPSAVRIRLPDGSEVSPLVDRSGDQVEARFASTQTPGEYRLIPRPGQRINYVVQASREESDLTPLTPARLDQLRGQLGLTVIDTSKTTMSAAMGNNRQAHELWPLLMAAVMVLAVGEMGLARMWGNNEK